MVQDYPFPNASLAVVRWKDSLLSANEYLEENDESIKVGVAVSTGWVVKNDDEAITLGMDYWEHRKEFRTCLIIPKCSVDHIEFPLGDKPPNWGTRK